MTIDFEKLREAAAARRRAELIENLTEKQRAREAELAQPDDPAEQPDYTPEELAPKYPRHEFVTGPAGTGKTFMMQDRVRQDPGVVLAATTGIAAMNLGAGVVTINSLLKYFDTQSLRDLWTEGRLTGILLRHARSGVRQIVVDEVSMMDGDQLTVLCLAFDDVNEHLEGQNQPGVGLTLTGDFCQLPPVEGKFAFEVDDWGRFTENTTRLTTIRRQADKDFIEALQAARRGEGKRALEFFGDLIKDQTDHGWTGTTLLARNVLVDNFNAMKMAEVKGKLVGWESQRWGDQRSEWKQVPQKLMLKVGTLVMVLANEKKLDPTTGVKLEEFEYVNGDLGELVEDDFGAALVKLKRGPLVRVVPVTRQVVVPLEPGRRKELKAEKGAAWHDFITEDGKKEVKGAITYMPLRVAYATTVHKSQGLSLDQVQVNIRDRFFESPGMLYVALSRARTAGGLRLVGRGETFLQRCRVDERVRGWL